MVVSNEKDSAHVLHEGSDARARADAKIRGSIEKASLDEGEW